jgi:heme-degrading monooxygenase HmoA
MILEQAVLTITPGSEGEFEAAIDQAKEVIAKAHGFRSLKLLRGLEQPSTYLLLNEWETLQDHMVGFRESELFLRWRELIGPYFASPPVVEHFGAAVVTRAGGD